MNTTTLRKFMMIGLVMVLAVSVQAQKFGYLDSATLLSELPAVKAADSEIETYQKQLISSGETKVKALQEKVMQYQKQAEQGLLSQVQMQQKEAELAEEQKILQQYEYEVQNKILKKREELLGPILDNVKKAVEAVGKDNGYTMIFDTATGTLLHANESDDVTALVKSKLGI